jgi:hypothetical protein
MQWEIIIAAALGGVIALTGGFFTNSWQNKRQREKGAVGSGLDI